MVKKLKSADNSVLSVTKNTVKSYLHGFTTTRFNYRKCVALHKQLRTYD
jgi:hypothetical protein